VKPAALEPRLEQLLRTLAPQVLGALVRRYGRFDAAEDATQLALIAATTQWPAQGLPEDPRAWLIVAAARRMTDLLRNEQARQRREESIARRLSAEARLAPSPDDASPAHHDSLILLFMCCHPSLTPASQIALTLRAVGGLTTAEIARAFLVPEDTITRRITRAKVTIRESGETFSLPLGPKRDVRLAAVMHVLYLIFNEGYASTAGAELHRSALSGEAIRLTRVLHAQLSDDPEVMGLLALMLLTDARRDARATLDGALVPMADQNRALWNAQLIEEGVALISAALPRGSVGPYQLQAAIAAVHDEAPNAAATDWPQIVALYELLLRLSDNPMVALNHAVAVAMATGAQAGLELVSKLATDARIADDHRFHAVRAHLLELNGELSAARAAYRLAAERTSSFPMQRYLNARAARLAAAE
jgi:RNA polymerase sigma factor (sigma-70 family)